MALAAQRLLPLFQQIFSAWANIKYGESSLNDVLHLLREKDDFHYYAEKNKTILKFDKAINLDNISFSYSNSNSNTIDNLSLTIKKGEKIGIIGLTGSGKSTLLDLLAGLLLPKQGYIQIDDNVLNEANRHSWKKNVAYVPQSIFLIDGTISENISMGVLNEPLDVDRLKKAAKIAQIDKFIDELQGGYEALIGANGVMLSGGQRQRIGIARAMYKKSTFIIFDEVTSALDRDTELNLLESIGEIDSSVTMIIVAHRPAALQVCDRIIKIDNGRIVDVGLYSHFFN
jgi:ATP-binding cassette subfamily B protein